LKNINDSPQVGESESKGSNTPVDDTHWISKSSSASSSSQAGKPESFKSPPQVLTQRNIKDWRKVSLNNKLYGEKTGSHSKRGIGTDMQQRNERTSLLEKTSLGHRVTNLVRGFWRKGVGGSSSGAELRQSPSFDAFQYSHNGKQPSAMDDDESDKLSKGHGINNMDRDQGDDSATIEEYDEFDVRQGPVDEEQSTHQDTLTRSELAKHLVGDIGNMLKAFIGLNFLYVSYAFAHAGLIRGTIGLILIALITEHCCLLLVQVKNQMPEAEDPSFRITYGDLGKYVLGGIGEKLVNGALILTQFGYCTGYLIFLGQTLHDLFGASVSPSVFVLIPLPILIPLSMLRSLRSLAPFSLAANFSLLIGFIAVISYIGSHFKWQPSSPSITQFPIFFGQITSALEGIGLVVPVEQSMKSRKHFKIVIEVAIGILSGVLLVVGALGFVTFGADTRSIIVLNMGSSPVVGLVKIVLCIGILFTYPLQLVPIVQAAEDWLAGRTITSSHGEPMEEFQEEEEEEEEETFSTDDQSSESELYDSAVEEAAPKELDIGENYYQRDDLEEGSEYDDETSEPEWANEEEWRRTKQRNLFERNPKNVMARLAIVFGTAVTAALAGSSFGLFQALVGSLGAASLAYIFPALFHLKLFRDQLAFGEKTKNLIILIFGLVGMLIGTYVSIMEMQKNPEY